MMRKYFCVILCILVLLGAVQTTSGTFGSSQTNIPIKIMVLIDGNDPNSNLTSFLYVNVHRLLTWNKIPFDIYDVSSGQGLSLSTSDNLNYSAVIIGASGSAINTNDSQSILSAINLGMGAVGILPSAANTALMPAFGISNLGSQELYAASFTVLKDEFTFAYTGSTISQASIYLNHSTGQGTDIIASFPAGGAAIWDYQFGDGKTIFFNTTATSTMSCWGLLLQSFLYVMPMGVCSPSNAMAIEVDDCPMTYYGQDYLERYYYDFMTNILAWLSAYHISSSFYNAFSYSYNINDFWTNPESLQAAADILLNGHELGLHCGSNHFALDPFYWGSIENVNTEVNAINQAIDLLKQKLLEQYGLILTDMTSYVPPNNIITDYGYQVLDSNTAVKYIGPLFAPSMSAGQAMSQSSMMQMQSVSPESNQDVLLEYLKSQADMEFILSRSKMETDKGSLSEPSESLATSEINNSLNILAALDLPLTFRDFGWEGISNVYNIPRVRGGFMGFSSQNPSALDKSILQSFLESGQPYIIFTHPDEADLYGDPSITMESVFTAYSTFANYIINNYPYYRWMKASQIGDYLSSRSGTVSAYWNAAAHTLNITLAQPDCIHIKSSEYIQSITGSDTSMTIVFSATPTDYQSSQFDIVKTANDYFIYPLGEKALMPEIPAQPFVFQPYNPVMQYTLSTSIIGQGSIIINPSQSTYNAGATIQLTAIPADGWSFSSWSGGISGSENPKSFTINQNTSITAIFTQGGESSVITKTVGSGADDGFAGAWGFYNNIGWYEAGNPGQPYSAWFRFTGITIPQGATITEAHLELAQAGWGSGTHLQICAEKIGNPAVPTSQGNLATKTRTTAKINWDSGYSDQAYHNSPSFAPVVQELVNSYSYSDSSIQLFLDNAGTTGEAIGLTLESGSPARLYIQYQTGSSGNHAPVLNPIGDKSVQVGQLLQFTVSASDSDNDLLTYSASNLPAGASFNPSTRAFTWTPSTAGTYPNIHFEVSDGSLTDYENITITVTDGQPPSSGELTVSISTGADDGFAGTWGFYNNIGWYEAGNPGQPYSAWFRFTGITIPQGAAITKAHLELLQTGWGSGASLQISAEDVASPVAPTSTANLNGKIKTSATTAFNSGYSDWAYHNTPDFASVVQELVNSYIYSNGAIQILINNIGASGEATGLTLESGSPARLYIQYQTGSSGNHAPVLNPIGDKSIQLGQSLQFAISASDPDNDPLTYSASNLPAGASFDPSTRTFNWTPSAAGIFPNIHFEVSDGSLMDYENITITVTDGQPPSSGELTVSISTGADDGFAGAWGFYNNIGWYEAGNPGQPYSAWFRFTGITIPQGATITEAHLELLQTGWGEGTHLKIGAEKSANPGAPSSQNDLAIKTRTTAKISWDSGFSDWAWHNSPDVTAVIQELVNSFSYNNGVIQIIIDDNASTAECIGLLTEGGYIPRLYIKWTVN